jgi:predicted ATP-grasp superfamily ATP-dependent carboligase
MVLFVKEKTWNLFNFKDKQTRLIYNDVTAIKVILFILVVLILTYFCYFGVGVEIVF